MSFKNVTSKYRYCGVGVFEDDLDHTLDYYTVILQVTDQMATQVE